jgi:sterol desaturase/sphingolipid hydroxylase (fatty acid hydroxylase superfamily)
VFTLGLSFLAGDGARRWLQSATGLDLSLCLLPLPAIVLAYLLIDTFCDYWSHRIQHTRLFWPIHRYHHSAEEFCVLTASRVHPGDFANVFFSIFLVGLFAVPGSVFLAYSAFISGLRYLIHSRIDSDFGWVGRYLFLSPAHHRAHHGAALQRGVGNFGLIPLWDALFGTLRPPAPQSTPIGVDTPYRHGYWVLTDMVRDSVEFASGIWAEIFGATLHRPRKPVAQR